MQQTNSSTPLSPEPPPKQPRAFQATPLNSVLMRLESWHGKLQLSKRHGRLEWMQKHTTKAKQATKIQTTQNNTPGRWRRKTTKNEMNKTILIHVSNLSTKTGCNKKIIEFIQALIFFFAVSSGSATDSSPMMGIIPWRQIDTLRFPKNGTVPHCSWTSLMIEVMVVSTVTWLSAMLPKVEAMRFCISWGPRCKSQVSERNTSCLSRPHLRSHLNSFMIYIYIHIIYCISLNLLYML